MDNEPRPLTELVEELNSRRKELEEATHKLIAKLARPAGSLTSREIATGADVGFDWFLKFKQGRIDSPAVERVQAVHDFLAAIDADHAPSVPPKSEAAEFARSG